MCFSVLVIPGGCIRARWPRRNPDCRDSQDASAPRGYAGNETRRALVRCTWAGGISNSETWSENPFPSAFTSASFIVHRRKKSCRLRFAPTSAIRDFSAGVSASVDQRVQVAAGAARFHVHAQPSPFGQRDQPVATAVADVETDRCGFPAHSRPRLSVLPFLEGQLTIGAGQPPAEKSPATRPGTGRTRAGAASRRNFLQRACSSRIQPAEGGPFAHRAAAKDQRGRRWRPRRCRRGATSRLPMRAGSAAFFRQVSRYCHD